MLSLDRIVAVNGNDDTPALDTHNLTGRANGFRFVNGTKEERDAALELARQYDPAVLIVDGILIERTV
jgi:hypothetical protein